MAPSAPLSQEEPTLPSPGKQFSNHLAAAVRSIDWTYAIFWSMSTSRPGVLTWKDGFYNGEVKTRKISNSTDLTADQLVLERSEQLRELYESLLSGECDHRARRPAASLTPEDLGDSEWYYTVCMTYAFRPGQGLPGKSFASNQHIWLCNAHFADTKIFQRALLAKTASIKTVACIPFMGGILELGTGDQVLEDTDMVNRIRTSFWELRFPTCSGVEEPSSSPSESQTGEADMVFEDLDHNAAQGMISEEIECLSNGNLELITKEIDEFNGLCEELDVRALEDNWIMDGSFQIMSSPEAALVPNVEGITDEVVTLSSSAESYRPSCFTAWRRSSDSSENVAASADGESQKLLKKAVAGGAWTNDDDGDGKARAQESNVKGHVMSERRRREKLNEMFEILKSLVPSIHKVDKASILAETIAYLKQLEQRIEELESSRAPTRLIAETTGRKRHDVSGKKALAGFKRKASELGDATEREDFSKSKDDGPSNVVNVTVMDKEVVLEVQCRWKELVMTRVFDALKALGLDVLSVQSSTPEGLLALKIRAQYAGSAAVAPGMISEALQKAIGKR